MRNERRHIIIRSVGFGALAAVLAYANYLYFFVRHNLIPDYIATDTPLYLQAITLAWLTLTFCLLVHLFFERADTHEHFLTDHLWSNKKLLRIVAASLIIIGFIIYSPFVASIFNTYALDIVDWLNALAAVGLFSVVRYSQRHTRKYSRHAVVALHHEVHSHHKQPN